MLAIYIAARLERHFTAPQARAVAEELEALWQAQTGDGFRDPNKWQAAEIAARLAPYFTAPQAQALAEEMETIWLEHLKIGDFTELKEIVRGLGR